MALYSKLRHVLLESHKEYIQEEPNWDLDGWEKK